MSYIRALLGKLGRGKTSFEVHSISHMKRLHPWAPVASTVPVALPGGALTLFLCRSAADYIAFSLCCTRFVYSQEAQLLSNTLRSRARRRALGKAGLDARLRTIEESLAPDFLAPVSVFLSENGRAYDALSLLDKVGTLLFAQLQKEYEAVALSIDPGDHTALDVWIAAHNWRVLHNRLTDPLLDMGDQGRALARHGSEFYRVARHVLDDYRFEFSPPSMPFHLFLDETGVSASSTDNADLRRSAFYSFLAQLRKFGGRVSWATHEPMLAFKQMRDITDVYLDLWSADVPGGRFYAVRGYSSVAAWEAKKKISGFEVAYIPYSRMGAYPTAWIVQQPPPLETDEGLTAKRKRGR